MDVIAGITGPRYVGDIGINNDEAEPTTGFRKTLIGNQIVCCPRRTRTTAEIYSAPIPWATNDALVMINMMSIP